MKFIIQVIILIVLFFTSILLDYLNCHFYGLILWYVRAIIMCWLEFCIVEKYFNKHDWLKCLIFAQGILFGILKTILYFRQ